MAVKDKKTATAPTTDRLNISEISGTDSQIDRYRITSIKRRGRLLNFSIFRGGGGGRL